MFRVFINPGLSLIMSSLLVVDGVYMVNVDIPFRSGSINIYLIKSSNEGLVVDTGYGEKCLKALVNAIKEIKLDKITIVNTHAHPDHFGANGLIKNLLSVRFAAHKLEASVIENPNLIIQNWWKTIREIVSEVDIRKPSTMDLLIRGIKPVKVDLKFEGGEVVNVGGRTVKVICTPGHSPGHLCLQVDDSLICGDLIGDSYVYVGPPDGDLVSYIKSLKMVKNLSVKRILPSHGQIILNPIEAISNHLNHHLDRLKAIIGNIPQDGVDIIELTRKIYGVADLIKLAVTYGRLKALIGLNMVRKRGRRYFLSGEHVDVVNSLCRLL